jgi:hypothetical protein
VPSAHVRAFVMASDGYGGTLITDPPASQQPLLSQRMHIGQPHCEHWSDASSRPTRKAIMRPPMSPLPLFDIDVLPMTAKLATASAHRDCGLTTKIAIGQRFDWGERFARCSALLPGCIQWPLRVSDVASHDCHSGASGNGGLRPARLSASHSFQSVA